MMTAITSVFSAILNSLWQALAVAALAGLTIRVLRRHLNAATRHLIWWLVMGAVILLPVVPRSAPSPAAQPARAPVATTGRALAVAAPLLPPQPEAPIAVTERRGAVWPVWAFAIWAIVFALRLLGIVRSFRHLRAIKARAKVWAHPLPANRRAARLLLSSEISSPVATGFLHPAVILPENLPAQLTEAEMDCVVLHEAAHLARFDDWGNLIARLLDIAMAAHPVAWWVRRQIDREREMACDDWVVAQTGSADSYAETLARMVELRPNPAHSLLATGIFTRRSHLRERIEMLLRRGRGFSPVAARLPLSAAIVALAVLIAGGVLAPRWIVFAQKMEFQVASIKRNVNNGPMESVPHRSGDLIRMHNIQPYSMIFYAYHLRGAYQMVGYKRLPDDWNWYDLDARIGGDATDDQIRLMMQSLLEDRFKLKVTRETRELPEYELVVAKDKAKLTPSSDQPMTLTIEGRTFTTGPGTCGRTAWRDGIHLICHSAGMATLVAEVSGELRAPVSDHTGLTGTYDLNVRYVPDDRRLDADAEFGPSLNQALQEELGLKLEKGAGPVEVIVIDHMEKPSEN
jgi:uncharacterized protein (TIGR03435 family)